MELGPARKNTAETAWSECSPRLPHPVIVRAIALIMESADCGWEIAKGWTTYLYSSGLHGHSAHLAKKATVTQAREEVAKIAQGMIAAELEDPREEAKERLSCRLLVSNLAADAEEDDIREFFLLHGFNLSVVLTSLRHPS